MASLLLPRDAQPERKELNKHMPTRNSDKKAIKRRLDLLKGVKK